MVTRRAARRLWWFQLSAEIGRLPTLISGCGGPSKALDNRVVHLVNAGILGASLMEAALAKLLALKAETGMFWINPDAVAWATERTDQSTQLKMMNGDVMVVEGALSTVCNRLNAVSQREPV